jgi:hypothetical protein
VDAHEGKGDGNKCEHAPDTEIYASADYDQSQATSENSKDGSLAKRVSMSVDLEERSIGIEDTAQNGHQEQREQGPCGRDSPNPSKKTALAAIAAVFG